jgi:hypothetical protein
MRLIDPGSKSALSVSRRELVRRNDCAPSSKCSSKQMEEEQEEVEEEEEEEEGEGPNGLARRSLGWVRMGIKSILF